MNSNILNYSGPLLITKGVSLVMHASNKDLEKEEFYFCMLETISHGLVLRLSKMLFLTRELMGIKHAWTKRIRTFLAIYRIFLNIFQILSEERPKIIRTFAIIFPRMSEDCRRFREDANMSRSYTTSNETPKWGNEKQLETVGAPVSGIGVEFHVSRINAVWYARCSPSLVRKLEKTI